MNQEISINSIVKLGEIFKSIASNSTWPGFSSGITEEEYTKFNELVELVHIYNGWFDAGSVRKSLSSWSLALTKPKIEKWLSYYKVPVAEPKTVAIIMAGNIPLVGFHDFLSVYLSGHHSLVKLSSDDNKLLPACIRLLELFDADIHNRVKIAEGKIENFNAVIATGSDNSATYFRSYFDRYPHIIRRNRTSIAILDGTETKEDIKNLGHDIFDFYGLGCRNVTKLYLPEGMDLNRVFEGIFDFQNIVHNKKYGNNYDYHKAVFLLERYDVLENGFILFKQDKSIHSPIGSMFYEYYKDINLLSKEIDAMKLDIQCIVGKSYLPYGSAQSPALLDYADGVDTMDFLTKL
jgi:hypothetical protein